MRSVVHKQLVRVLHIQQAVYEIHRWSWNKKIIVILSGMENDNANFMRVAQKLYWAAMLSFSQFNSIILKLKKRNFYTDDNLDHFNVSLPKVCVVFLLHNYN